MKDLLRESFFGFVAIAMAIEFIGADLFCLFFATDRVAELLEIDLALAESHMLTLAFWNGFATLGAGMVLFSLRNHEWVQVRRTGIVLTVLALLGYACYQFLFATTQLGDHRIYVQGAAVVYALFGISAALIGRSLFRSDWRPDQPVSASDYRPADTLDRLKVAGF
jgi:hypothetical protein